MAGDLEEKAGTGVASPKQPYSADDISSGSNTPTNKELTDGEVAALKARVINENEEKQEELKKERGPTIPAASFWMKKNDELFDQVATQPSIYDDPQLAKYFQPHPKYENLHRFDPSERWTWREELVRNLAPSMFTRKHTKNSQKVLNRIDLKITIWACIAFFGLDLGRGNLSQANSDSEYLSREAYTTLQQYELANAYASSD